MSSDWFIALFKSAAILVFLTCTSVENRSITDTKMLSCSIMLRERQNDAKPFNDGRKFEFKTVKYFQMSIVLMQITKQTARIESS